MTFHPHWHLVIQHLDVFCMCEFINWMFKSLFMVSFLSFIIFNVTFSCYFCQKLQYHNIWLYLLVMWHAYMSWLYMVMKTFCWLGALRKITFFNNNRLIKTFCWSQDLVFTDLSFLFHRSCPWFVLVLTILNLATHVLGVSIYYKYMNGMDFFEKLLFGCI